MRRVRVSRLLGVSAGILAALHDRDMVQDVVGEELSAHWRPDPLSVPVVSASCDLTSPLKRYGASRPSTGMGVSSPLGSAGECISLLIAAELGLHGDDGLGNAFSTRTGSSVVRVENACPRPESPCRTR